MNYSFAKIWIILESNLITPRSCTIYYIVALDGMNFSSESIHEGNSLYFAGLLIFNKIYKFSLVQYIGWDKRFRHLNPVALCGCEDCCYDHP